jgi:hypothetical protein
MSLLAGEGLALVQQQILAIENRDWKCALRLQIKMQQLMRHGEPVNIGRARGVLRCIAAELHGLEAPV